MHIAMRAVLGVSVLCVGFSVSAQQPIIYPAKGQTAQQQASDDAACITWAKQSTGIDPAAIAQAPPVAAAQTGPAVGGGQRIRGAVRGAAGGAIIGEIVGNDAGKGAATGAVVGTMVGGAKARQQQQAQKQTQQQQAQTQQQQQIDTYNRAYGACMEGRGYTVK